MLIIRSGKRARRGLSRRQLLRHLGVGAAASPLIPLLNASGQEAARPKRLVLVFTPDGIGARDYNTANTVDWKPTGTEKEFTLHQIHAPLEPWKSKLVIPWGLTLTAGGAGEQHAYGMAGLWTAATLPGPSAGADFDGGNGNRTGWGAAPSIDQIVAQASGPNMPYARPPTDASQETRYRSVALGVQSGQPTSVTRMTYSGPGTPIHPETNPRAAFDRLFAGVTPGGMQPVEDPAKVQARNEQKALCDILKGDLARIRTRVGAEEHKKVDSHLEWVTSMERRLTATTLPPPTSVGCTIPTAPPTSSGSGGGNANFPNQINQMIDIATHVLACDITRVLTLQMSCGFSNITHTWLGHTSAHHTMSHDDTDRRTELQAIDSWYSQQIASLLMALDSVQEGNGTLLDNCLVVCGRELGSTAHRMDRVPFLIAGKAGGALQTQRFLNFDKQQHAKLLVSIARVMGLDSLNSVGNRQMDSGPLAL
jgi:hypothetical protein